MKPHNESMGFNLANKHIAVLMGGPGSERKVSLASGRGVVTALRERGANVTEIDVNGPDFSTPDGIQIAFNVIHGTFGEDGQVQRILESRGLAYTGEGGGRQRTCDRQNRHEEAASRARRSDAAF